MIINAISSNNNGRMDFLDLPYFFCYKMESFSFQNNPKNLDPSYKIDLDVLGLFRKGNTHIIAKFRSTHLVICSHLRGRKIPSYNQIHTVQCNEGL